MTDGPTGDRDTAADADLEPDTGDAAFRAHEAPRISAPCRITVYHTRARLADMDGISIKAVLDGAVGAGIFADDSPEQIAEIIHRQSKGKPEETRFVIEVIE